MSPQLVDKGEEYRKRLLSGDINPPTAYEVLLFNNSEDQLTDDSDLTDITTEPDDGNYSRLSYPLGGETLTQQTDANGDWQLVFTQQDFDLVNTTGGYVDSGGIVVPFQADGDSGPTPHLFFFTELTNGQDDPDPVDLIGTPEVGFSATLIDTDVGQ